MKQKPITLMDPLPSRYFRGSHRPTITGLVITPDNSLLMVRPRRAKKNGWIFPQGGFQPSESPLQALVRELREELGYDLTALDTDSITLLAADTWGHPKKFYVVVAVRLTHWKAPVLNHENSAWCTPGGPNELWRRVAMCSESKRRLISAAIAAAYTAKLL